MPSRRGLKASLYILSLLICLFAALCQVAFAGLGQDPPAGQDVVLDDVEIRGNRRIPKESILYYVQSKPGDRYNPDLARRDLESVLSQGWFDPLRTRILLDDSPRGGKVLIFEVREYPMIRAMEYRGLKSATESEILERFKERRVQVSKDSQLDPAKVNSARIVLRELLGEKGHPEAKVELEVEEISASAVSLVFDIEEGPRVRVKEIDFVTDRNVFSERRLRGAMKLVKEAGLMTSFTSKDIYHREKLLDDLERVRFYLGQKGYIQAKIGEPQIEPAGNVSAGIPLPGLRKSGPGLKVTIPIEVGRRYKIAKIDEKGVTVFPMGVVTLVSGLKVGEYANAKTIQEGVYKGVKDIYGERGYIQASTDFVPTSYKDISAEEGEVEVTLEVDEGKQFSLRRLEFVGNTNTRDRVMRREVLLNEGDPYNKKYWDLSILRLNQLGLFEEIKEKDAITRTNERDQTVDIDLQVKEKGRQQIQLNGGVSGYAGSFFGIEYSTNNLLGYGETLSFALSGGNRQLYAMIGFTEPYFLGRPVSLGFQLFAQRYQFIGSGFNAANAGTLLQSSIFGLSSVDAATLFTQNTAGGTVSLSAPMALFTGGRFRRFAGLSRLGLSYSLTGNNIKDPDVNRDSDPRNDIPVTYSQPRIITSRITPSLYFNSLNAAIDPTRGQSLFLGFSLAGGFLGGDVNTFSPSVEYKFFKPVFRTRTEHPHVFGMRFMAGHIRAFGTVLDTQSLSFVGGIPVYERYFIGGEDTIRGYNVRSISPAVPTATFLSTQNVMPFVADSALSLNPAPAGTVAPSVLRRYTFDAPAGACATVPTPANCNVQTGGVFFTPIGGDTQLLVNMEYRVPIIGPLSVAAFGDVGTSVNLNDYDDQLVTTNFQPQLLTPNGVTLNPAGREATQDELANAPTDLNGSPIGYRTIFLQGDSRRYDIVRTSQGNASFLRQLRASVGLELRVQMPVINVPFRLIFAYNPNAKTDPNDPTVFYIERRTVVRFSIGRTF